MAARLGGVPAPSVPVNRPCPRVHSRAARCQPARSGLPMHSRRPERPVTGHRSSTWDLTVRAIRPVSPPAPAWWNGRRKPASCGVPATSVPVTRHDPTHTHAPLPAGRIARARRPSRQAQRPATGRHSSTANSYSRRRKTKVHSIAEASIAPSSSPRRTLLHDLIGYDGTGYQTGLASSPNLVEWQKEACILRRDPSSPVPGTTSR